MKIDVSAKLRVLAGVLVLISAGGGLWADDHGHDAPTTTAASAPAVAAPGFTGIPAHVGATPVTPAQAAAAASPAAVKKSSDQTLSLIREAAWALLKEGNERYVTGKSKHPNQTADRREIVVSEGQKPFASILACSDSRSPVEVLFDRGVGDLFVVRVAGNVAGTSELATLEYGIGHLGTPLLVVLGHTGCGAVNAACKGGELHGHLPDLIAHIKPAVDRAKALTAEPDRLVPTAIQANVWHTIEEVITSSEEIRKHLKEGDLQIVGGIYDLQSGVVNWLGSHPTQEILIQQGEKAGGLAHGQPGAGHGAAPTAVASGSRAQDHGGGASDHSGDSDALPKGFKSLLPAALAQVDEEDDAPAQPKAQHGPAKRPASGGAIEVQARTKKSAAAAPSSGSGHH